MPTYKYRREDGTTFTIRQRITADALSECPDTGQPVERVITGGTGFHLKGGGWYKDGYGSPTEKKPENETPSSSSEKAKENGTPEKKSSEAKESKPAAKESA